MATSDKTSGAEDRIAANPFRAVPAVGAVIERLAATEAGAPAAPELLAFLTRREIAAIKNEIAAALKAGQKSAPPDLDGVAARVRERLAEWRADSGTCRVVNGTGIVLHSGLGRAVLPKAAVDALARLDGYCLLEVDKENGERRKRDAFLEEIIVEITGAEAALVVNNNAAATMLVLNTTSAGKEVIVSRSQSIEIGGSFRMPDVMLMSGCRLHDVGTTNRSYVSDYDEAIGEATGALLLVHTSNYRIFGFTEHVGIEAMVELGARRGLPVIHDLGSGSLLPFDRMGFEEEHPVQTSVRAGADLITFSGDKMIGGTQAGIIVGKKSWVERCRKNALARALRVDKLTCVALEASLRLYLEGRPLESVPTLAMMMKDAGELERAARSLADAIGHALGKALSVEVVAESSEMGAGSLPARKLPTFCVALRSASIYAGDFARRLRMRPIPVFTRVKDDRILIDSRTLLEGDAGRIVAALAEIAGHMRT